MALLTISISASAQSKINLKDLSAKQVPILLEFGRGWCIPCKYMKPILEDMSSCLSRQGNRHDRGHGCEQRPCSEAFESE